MRGVSCAKVRTFPVHEQGCTKDPDDTPPPLQHRDLRGSA